MRTNVDRDARRWSLILALAFSWRAEAQTPTSSQTPVQGIYYVASDPGTDGYLVGNVAIVGAAPAYRVVGWWMPMASSRTDAAWIDGPLTQTRNGDFVTTIATPLVGRFKNDTMLIMHSASEPDSTKWRYLAFGRLTENGMFALLPDGVYRVHGSKGDEAFSGTVTVVMARAIHPDLPPRDTESAIVYVNIKGASGQEIQSTALGTVDKTGRLRISNATIDGWKGSTIVGSVQAGQITADVNINIGPGYFRISLTGAK